jgi:prepilin-type N-terminal cleavage/methylation domain-containing protein
VKSLNPVRLSRKLEVITEMTRETVVLAKPAGNIRGNGRSLEERRSGEPVGKFLENRRVGRSHGARNRFGMTLIELMVAMTISLIMIYAMLRFFGDLMSSVADGRAAIEMSGQLRGAAHRLQSDLRGVTAPMRPWISPSAGVGYFEYIENAGHDSNPFGPAVDLNNPVDYSLATHGGTFGDFDDVLAFTTRSHGKPFIGQLDIDGSGASPPVPIESHFAEVFWWASRQLNALDEAEPQVLRPGQVSLRRRALLIRPDVQIGNNPPGLIAEVPRANLRNFVREFYNTNDISVRFEIDSANDRVRIWANSLASLTKRENRTAHAPIFWADPQPLNPVDQFPFMMHDVWTNDGIFIRPRPDDNRMTLATLTHFGLKEGEDVILANVAAFDVKAYDPFAPVRIHPGTVETVVPGDPGFNAGGAVVSAGAFVDLWFGRHTPSVPPAPGMQPPYFRDPPSRAALPRADTTWPYGIYDTWSFHYEHDGFDQDGILGPDQGTNGRDSNNTNGVDDLSERETAPPYPVPLRGIQVTIRMIEPDSRQVRQFSVVSDFTPD